MNQQVIFDKKQLDERLKQFALQLIVTVLAIFSFAGCITVGPDYTPPEVSAPEQWNSVLKGGLISESVDTEMLVDNF